MLALGLARASVSFLFPPKPLKCSVCHKRRKGFTGERLGEVLDPILRQHLRQGREIPKIGEGDVLGR
jgi:hypothetical protein